MARPKVDYEWVCEIVDAHGDIIEPLFADTLVEALGYRDHEYEGKASVQIALVKHEYTDIDGELGRGYAYLEDGKLPESFEDGNVNPDIPVRFRNEVANCPLELA